MTRVLLPLDGSWEAAAAVAPTAALLAHAGLELVVLHVFHAATVPPFWDQAAHFRSSWEPEFLARYSPNPGVRLHLRSGVPGEQLVSVAAEERVHLIALGWSQRLDADRAATVRWVLRDARVPVLLMPVREPGS
ncbi:MAG TPA: universal stress protein, partial [Myxococcaceae bacterium]|nr:universal stress protein [Myxococcaceae bacterium]